MFYRAAAALIAVLSFSSAIAGPASTAHDFAFISIEGEPLAMSEFEGQPVLVVNTASRCGYTRQYAGLQALYDQYRAQGLVVLGVPSNSFRQELSSAEDVKDFCEVNFGLDFPMTQIEPVRGERAHPLFGWLQQQGAVPGWNFNKFLIDGDGQFAAHFGAATRPSSAKLRAEITPLLRP